MNGVTIIAEHVVDNYGPEWWLAAVVAGLGTLLAFLYVIYTIMDSWELAPDFEEKLMVGVMSLAILVCGAACVFFIRQAMDDSTHVEYTVTLDESVSYLEFTEKYEVLSEEDGIYRVRERESEDGDK